MPRDKWEAVYASCYPCCHRQVFFGINRSVASRSIRSRERSKRRWATVAQATQKQKRERKVGRSCLAFTRAGLGFIYDKSKVVGDNLCYAEGERNWGKGRWKVEVLLATEVKNHAALYVDVQCLDNEQN